MYRHPKEPSEVPNRWEKLTNLLCDKVIAH
jgi:hypothetical protein